MRKLRRSSEEIRSRAARAALLAIFAALLVGSAFFALQWHATRTGLQSIVAARAAEIAHFSEGSSSGTRMTAPWRRSAAVKWLRSAPLGLFIHFGPSSSLAAPSDRSWFVRDTSSEGRQAAVEFAPDPAVADQWTRFASRLGASYITVVAKHHDGFALWPTRTSSWSVPPSEDLIGRAAADARRAHLRLFIYYSLVDWHEPTYKRDPGAYVSFMEAQLRELLTRYGPVAGVWFDGSWDGGVSVPELEQLFAFVHRLQPWALVTDNGHRAPLPGEDFQTFEGGLPGDKATIGNASVANLPLQAAVKLGNSWFWDGRPDPVSGAAFRQLRARARAAHVSLLADLGPAPDGRIPAVTRRGLLAAGG